MSPVILFGVVCMLFVVYGVYSTFQLKSRVLIIYHRVTGQVLEQFAKINDRTVDIDGKRFTIMPDRHSLLWWNRGIHQFFGTWVITYEFSYYSKYPHDPKNFKDVVVSPAVAKVLNNEDRMKSFARGVSNQGAGIKKGGMFEKYLPYAMVAILLILIVFIFQMRGQIGAIINTLQINGIVGK